MELYNAYLDVDSLKATLRITNDTFDDALGLAIQSASRQIDRYCHDQFWLSPEPTAKIMAPDVPLSLFTGSFINPESVIVQTDTAGDGTFDLTWTLGVDWQPEPLAPAVGFPYNQITAVGTKFFPGSRQQPYLSYPYNGYGYGYAGGYMYSGPNYGQTWFGTSQRARVQVTARWGWPWVPPEVVQATQILAIDHYKSKDVTNGAAGTSGLSSGSFGSVRGIQVVPSALNPMAINLLCGLRDVVVA